MPDLALRDMRGVRHDSEIVNSLVAGQVMGLDLGIYAEHHWEVIPDVEVGEHDGEGHWCTRCWATDFGPQDLPFCQHQPGPYYDSMFAAWDVLDELDPAFEATVRRIREGGWACRISMWDDIAGWEVLADNAMAAICLTALASKGYDLDCIPEEGTD